MSEVADVQAMMLGELAEGGQLTTAELTARLNAVLSGEAREPVTTGQVHALLTAAALAGQVRIGAREGSSLKVAVWSANRVVLCWGEPEREQSFEEWSKYQADSAPPGTYVPNMSDAWKARWKAKMAGTRSGPLRVEVRKSTGITRGGSCQVKMVVGEDGSVVMSMNGTAEFTAREFAEMGAAVTEARAAMARWRADGTVPGRAAKAAASA